LRLIALSLFNKLIGGLCHLFVLKNVPDVFGLLAKATLSQRVQSLVECRRQDLLYGIRIPKGGQYKAAFELECELLRRLFSRSP
jgi:hypothetical protein